MSIFITRLRPLLGGALFTIFVALPAMADDTEIYVSVAESSNARPNILFILDTSGSMDTPVVTTPPYDPNQVYPSLGCDPNRIYFSTTDTPPSCGSSNWFPRASNHCLASQAVLVNIGGSGVWPAFGNPRKRAGQYRSNQWRTLSGGDSGAVECQDDNGVHGQNNTTNNKFIKNNSNPPWGASSTLSWSNIGTTYRFYTANYLNYRNGPGVPTSMTRLQIVRDVAISLANSLENVNLGLMRYSTDAEGGYVLNAVENIATSRSSIVSTLNSFSPTSGIGGTPLSETYYEAARYLTGRSVDYGDRSSPGLSVDASRTTPGSSTYKSPLEFQCQKNYVVYLTDGAPTRDEGAIAKTEAMMGQACAPDPVEPFHDGGWTLGSGVCMDDLARWLNTTDLSSSQPGDQTAATYMIGFGDGLVGTKGYLDTIAQAGGTSQAYTAADVPTLTEALQTIFSSIQEEASTFVTPAVTVNAFNRAQTSDDLFFSLFKAAPRMHWPGNLKKYRLKGTTIVDANDAPAIDANGFFASSSHSIWSPAVDGNDVTLGGAVSQLPDPAKRNLYTYLSTNKALQANENALSTANAALNDKLVGVSAATSCSQACKDAIDWARGFDVKDLDKDGIKDEAVRYMGDPLHGRPGVVIYAGTTAAPDATDTVVFTPTNDGFLHAITGKTTGVGQGGGEELWAFMPPELLSRLHDLYEDNSVSPRSYGLDGDVQVLKFDKNQDGIVDFNAGDRVWLFFGMRMGGNHYYALDVTKRDDPQLMWNIGPNELPGVGQTWSAPVIARVKVGAGGSINKSAEKFVLIFGGGYDTGQESQPYSADFVGNRIYMVDAESGDLLWYAGGPGTGTPNLDLSQMTNSIPGKITVIDTNGDLFADRMYAGDMGGRVWRFDIYNDQPVGSLVTGGVIARLGAGDNGVQPNSAARRFYNAPDVALIQRRGEDPYYNIAIGSGYRGHPLDEVTQERFYSIRDKQPFEQLTQNAYDALTPLLDSDLVDITSDPIGTEVAPEKPGWKLALSQQPGRSGEKVLAEATTVNGVILFTTFQPTKPLASDPCFPANINRAYAISVSGKPALDFTDDGTIDNTDLSIDLKQQGIVGDITVAVLRPDDGTNDPNTPPAAPPTVCIAGVEVLKKCVGVGGTVRTFWQRGDAQ